jgi:DNA-binding response OmpR family regulator
MLAHARVLVAEDDRELLDTVAQALERAGAQVVRAMSGAELLERMADSGPFDLVVADVSMPLTSGLFALHSARNVGLHTPIIVMTALKDESLPDQVRSLGKNAVLLRKPFGLAELEAVASRLLSSNEKARAF